MPDQKPKNLFKTKIKKAVNESLDEERILLSWRAPLRPFKKRRGRYFTTIGTTLTLLIVILLFLREFLLIGVILALTFVAYVLATVPPEKVENKITTKGVTTAGHYYPWEKLSSFWFTETYGQKILNIKTTLGYPGQILFLLGEMKEDNKLRKLLSGYLKFEEEPPRSFLDNVAKSLAKTLPVEKSE